MASDSLDPHWCPLFFKELLVFPLKKMKKSKRFSEVFLPGKVRD